jgi:hypothetical protein
VVHGAGADPLRPGDRSQQAAQVELRRLQHGPGPRRGQRGHPVVSVMACQAWMRSFVCFVLFCFTSKHGTILISWACGTLQPAGHLQGPIQEGQQHPCKCTLVPSKRHEPYGSVSSTATVHWSNLDQFIFVKKGGKKNVSCFTK